MIDPILIAVAVALCVALVWLIILQVRFSRLLATYRRLISGVQAGNLEQIMSMHVGRINEHDRRLASLDQRSTDLERVLRTAIQRVGLVRFNPFDETGGDQSFAIALMDQHANGVVISSLHNRAETRIYAKPIELGRSRYHLSEEEEQALAQATGADTPLAEPTR